MTSRERIEAVLRHEPVDRVPLDLGGCSVTGMHVSVVYALRQALRLDFPGTPVKVIDPFQMLGEIAADLIAALEIDTIALEGQGTFFGFKKEGWKPWKTFDGTPVLVPEGFNTCPGADGAILMYPGGDITAQPSGRMPANGHYFDAIIRQDPVDLANLRPEDNCEEFVPIPEDELRFLESRSRDLYNTTDKALFGSFPGAGFGDLAWLPAPFLASPKGIRTYDEWYASLLVRPTFVHRVFETQCDRALENLRRYQRAVENRISLLFLSGADYGTQHGLQIAPDLFRDLYLPYYRRLNDWIHTNTEWRSFLHSCGAVEPLIDLFIEAGFDVLNPVQCSASGMTPELLKQKYGDRIVFWGGGVDTQNTLPFATPEVIRAEVADRIRTLGNNGGFVFNQVHNIQPRTPVENVLAMYAAWREHRHYA